MKSNLHFPKQRRYLVKSGDVYSLANHFNDRLSRGHLGFQTYFCIQLAVLSHDWNLWKIPPVFVREWDFKKQIKSFKIKVYIFGNNSIFCKMK